MINRYVSHPKSKPITNEMLLKGNYEIEILGKRHPAKIYLNSPFDPKNQRLLGHYEQHVPELSNFED